MREIGVGMVGYKFMGKAHSNAYFTVAKFFDLQAAPVMRCLAGRSGAGAEAAARRFGWAGSTDSWERMLDRDDIEIVDISAPSIVHRDVALRAAERGKHVFCEKPLAFSVAEAVEMVRAVKKAGVKHMIGFNYRRVPALALARQLIQEGRIGRIHHFRATYLQDWLLDPQFPMNWRLRKREAGSGSHGDLGAHLIDTAHFLAGEIDEVIGTSETFVHERPAEGSSDGLTAQAGSGTEAVDVDDATLFLARFKSGALGSFEATRFAAGRKNWNRIEVNGSQGSLAFCFERMNELDFYSLDDPPHARGFRNILATEGVHPYVSAWWPPGHVLGYEHTFVHEVADLVEAITRDRTLTPDFVDGLKVQCVLEAVEQSISARAWQKVVVPAL
jgi:predicted dehydrogenase